MVAVTQVTVPPWLLGHLRCSLQTPIAQVRILLIHKIVEVLSRNPDLFLRMSPLAMHKKDPMPS